jgi:hypothetical protein
LEEAQAVKRPDCTGPIVKGNEYTGPYLVCPYNPGLEPEDWEACCAACIAARERAEDRAYDMSVEEE